MNPTPLTRRNPFSNDVVRLRDEMERTFDRIFGEPFGIIEPLPVRGEGWMPPIDLTETENEVLIRAEIPGIPAKDLEITVTGTLLTISGSKKEETEKKGVDFYRCERRFGAFRRMIELPETIDSDKVAAESENGILLVHVAKKPGAKPRAIEVKPTSKKVPVS